MSDDDVRGPGAGTGRRVSVLVGAGAVLALVIGCLTVLSPAVRDQLKSSFTRRPAGYTELFFAADPPVLLRPGPAKPPTGEIRFTISSHELERTTYRYRVFVRNGTGAILGETAAEISLGSEESVQVKSVGPISQQRPADAGSVTVSLDGRPERLSYLFPAPGRTR